MLWIQRSRSLLQAPQLGTGTKSLEWVWIIPFLVALDQLTKALAPPSRLQLDPGSGTWLPTAIGRAFKGSVSGELLDGIGCVLLPAVAAAVIQRTRRPITRLGSVVLLGGLTSNLLDRLGMAAVTQHVGGRVVVNWFFVAHGRLRFGNLADLCYGAGSTLLAIAVLTSLSLRFVVGRSGLAFAMALVSPAELAGQFACGFRCTAASAVPNPVRCPCSQIRVRANRERGDRGPPPRTGEALPKPWA